MTGLLNVPDDCVCDVDGIELIAARPPGVNVPQEAGVAGMLRQLEMVDRISKDHTLIVALSGGGSALMPCPHEGVSLEDKQSLIKGLAAAGASITQLNNVRSLFSRVEDLRD
jgi:hydroxypyruvate reductase